MINISSGHINSGEQELVITDHNTGREISVAIDVSYTPTVRAFIDLLTVVDADQDIINHMREYLPEDED